MNYKKFSRAATAALIIVIAISTFAPSAWAQITYKTLYSFAGHGDGKSPQAGLIFDAAGNLYGTTSAGGKHDGGTVFELTLNPDGSWSEKVLYRFCSSPTCRGGINPTASLIFDNAGNLYGTASSGGAYGNGTVFKLTPSADGRWTEKVLHTFTGGKDGGSPVAGLIFDQAGNLYGTTTGGGTTGCWYDWTCGVIFELTPQANGRWKEKVLHAFHGKDGYVPEAGLIFDQAGNLYSTAPISTPGVYTVAFELTPNANGSWKEKVLHRFWDYTCCPFDSTQAGLIFDQQWNLYGTTSASGAAEAGSAFELVPNADGTWKEKTLHMFCSQSSCSDGANPEAGLVFDQAGNLYGTTAGGGANGSGVIFELTPNADGSWTESSLHDFCSLAACADGAGPVAGLIFDSAGNLYGTASSGGGLGFGVVFELTP